MGWLEEAEKCLTEKQIDEMLASIRKENNEYLKLGIYLDLPDTSNIHQSVCSNCHKTLTNKERYNNCFVSYGYPGTTPYLSFFCDECRKNIRSTDIWGKDNYAKN